MPDTVYDSDQQEQQGADSRPSVSPEQVRDLERSFAAPAYGEGQAKGPKNNDGGPADKFGDSDKKSNSTKDNAPASSSELADGEDEAADGSPKTPGVREGGEEAKSIYDRLNYTGEGDGKKGRKPLTSRLFQSKSITKKRIAIVGALAGGSVTVGLIAFFALLPFKVTAVMTMIQNRFTATATTAIDKETEKLFSSYVGKYVLPGIVNGRCRSTIDATCVGNLSGHDGPVKKLYEGWKQAKIETKLASKYGIVIGKKGDQFFMNIDGQIMPNSNKALRDLLNSPANHSIFDVANSTGSGSASRQEVRLAVRNALKDATFYDKTFYRLKVMKLLASKYGLNFCVVACNLSDTAHNKISDAKLTAKAKLYQRMLPEKWGLVMTCVMSGCITDSLLDASPGDTERLTPFQKDFQTQLANFAKKFPNESLPDLIKKSNDISKDGFKKYIAREAVKALVGKVGGSDAAALAAGETAEKAMGPIGWIVFALQVLNGATKIGPILQYAGYAASVATAVEVYQTYNTVSSECKSGHCSMTELGSFSNALETNLSGSKTNSVSFTASPLYNAYFGSDTPTTASIFSSLLPGTASADGEAMDIPCDDGSLLPKRQLVCPEMHFDQNGSKVASAVSDTLNLVPGLSAVTGWISKIISAPASALGSLIEKIPGVDTVMGWAGDLVGGPLSWVMDKLITTPGVDSGARQIDMVIAGAEKAGADATKAVGGVTGSTAAVNAIQNEAVAEAKAQFDSQPLLARMFSTSSPYSFISRLAIAMPTNLVTAAHSGLASLLTDPFSRLTSLVSTAFSPQNVFADSTVPEQFGITQYVFPESAMPNDPEAYWDANCQGDFMTPWLNSQQFNDKTGEADAHTPNPCLLIQATTQAAGVLFGVPQS
jgi:hypothetical protein